MRLRARRRSPATTRDAGRRSRGDRRPQSCHRPPAGHPRPHGSVRLHGNDDLSSRRRSRFLRPPEGADDRVLPRDVGALLLLRDARVPGGVHHHPGRGWRPGREQGHRRHRLRALRLAGLPDEPPGRLARRSLPRPATRGALRRRHHHVRPHRPGHPVPRHVLRRPRPHHRRHRPAQAQRVDDRRPALRQERHPPRRRLFDLLHGHQHRRVHRAAGVRLPRAERELPRLPVQQGHRHEPGLAPRLRRGRGRYGAGHRDLPAHAQAPRRCRSRSGAAPRGRRSQARPQQGVAHRRRDRRDHPGVRAVAHAVAVLVRVGPVDQPRRSHRQRHPARQGGGRRHASASASRWWRSRCS
jgi:hypothetical protein